MFEQIVGLISALIWPLTTLILFFSLKAEISALVGRVKRLKHGETELDFNERLLEIVEAVEEDRELETSSVITPPDDLIEELLKIDPFSAILASWVEFSNAAHSAIGNPNQSPLSPLRMIDKLEKQGLVSESDAAILNQIRAVRNHAAHHRTEHIDGKTAWKVCQVLQVITEELRVKSR
jgi:hypothetical protein